MESNLTITATDRWSGLMLVFTAVAGGGIALLIWAVEHAQLPWYLHIPVAGLALGLISGGALAAGWAYYNLELAQRQEAAPGADGQH